jgi:hypothetical protein
MPWWGWLGAFCSATYVKRDISRLRFGSVALLLIGVAFIQGSSSTA